MNWFLIIWIILSVVLLIATIVAIAYKFPKIKSTCTADKDCGFGYKCFENKCIKQIEKPCNISTSPDKLTSCKIDQDCENCTGTLKYKCIDVKNDYKIKVNGEVEDVPNGNWCLPEIESKINCNINTSDRILISDGDKYFWGCHCKTNIIGQKSPRENCDTVNSQICDGKLYVAPKEMKTCKINSDCGSGEICSVTAKQLEHLKLRGTITSISDLCKKVKCQCLVDWSNNQDIDPTNGMCSCPEGTISSNNKIADNFYDIRCKKDFCEPYGNADSNKKCICEDGYINCPNMDLSYCTFPTCVMDPCKPGGVFDKTLEKCKCFCNQNKCYEEITESNFVGSKCRDICSKAENACFNGGQCVVDNPENKTTKCNCPDGWKGKNCQESCRRNGEIVIKSEECCSGRTKFTIAGYECI